VGDNPVADVGGARGAGLKAIWFRNREFAQCSVLSRVNEIAGGLKPLTGDALEHLGRAAADLAREAGEAGEAGTSADAGKARETDAAPDLGPWGVDPAQVAADAVIEHMHDLPAAVRRLNRRD